MKPTAPMTKPYRRETRIMEGQLEMLGMDQILGIIENSFCLSYNHLI